MSGRIACLLALALLYRLADVLSLPTLKRLAAASMASPMPVEKACRLRAHVSWYDGRYGTETLIGWHHLLRLEGPIERRQVYRRAVICAPLLEDDPPLSGIPAPVIRRAFCGEAPLLHAMGLQVPAGARLRLRHEPVHFRDEPSKLDAHLARTTDISCR